MKKNSSPLSGLVQLGAIVILAVGIVCANESRAQTEELQASTRALQVDFFGGYTGFDKEAYRLVRTVIGDLVARGDIKHFITMEKGMSGGGRFCLELSDTTTMSIEQLTHYLSKIAPVEGAAVYKVENKEKCL